MNTNTRPFLDTPLAAAAQYLDRPAVVGRNREWTWRQVHTASIALADRLEGVETVGNLCSSRVGFLITWLAALRRGCVQLLPPSLGHAELAGMPWAHHNCRIIVDDAGEMEPAWAPLAHCMEVVPGAATAGLSDAELEWSPTWDRLSINLFTSGSTGTPQSQLKSLKQLMLGGNVLAARLETEVDGGMRALRRMVCSVPPQHMFGVETSVILPLLYGIPVLEHRPLLPADVRSAIESEDEGTLWIATPLHLRAVAQAGDPIAHCAAVITSTMPLSQALAAQAETLLNAPVLEIYGSTETGAVATRRTACDTHWHPLHGVRLTPTASGVEAWGLHFSSPQALADQIEFDSPDAFTLLGRQSDLIKIGGRRASLTGLNLMLSELPGLIDGVFYLPATGAPTPRLALIHAGADLDLARTKAWLRQRMDPAFVPRTFIRVERLPRSPSGKLTRAALDDVYRAWLAGRVGK